MVQYKTSSGTLGQFDPGKLYRIMVTEDNRFTVELKHYGWDEYDFWYETLEDIVELRIG